MYSMAGRVKKSKPSGPPTTGRGRSTRLSPRTKKQIDSLPVHAQEIYKEAHASALQQYQNPEKRRGGKRESAEEVAHKVAWSAVKKKYKKEGTEWVKNQS
jgi:cation transport regulator